MPHHFLRITDIYTIISRACFKLFPKTVTMDIGYTRSFTDILDLGMYAFNSGLVYQSNKNILKTENNIILLLLTNGSRSATIRILTMTRRKKNDQI